MELATVSGWPVYHMQSIRKKRSRGENAAQSWNYASTVRYAETDANGNNENVTWACFNTAPDLQKSYVLCVPILCSVRCVCTSNKFICSLHFVCIRKKKKIKTPWCISQKTRQGWQLRCWQQVTPACNLCPRGLVSSSNLMLELRLPSNFIGVPFQNPWVYREYSDLSSHILISKLSHTLHSMVI